MKFILEINFDGDVGADNKNNLLSALSEDGNMSVRDLSGATGTGFSNEIIDSQTAGFLIEILGTTAIGVAIKCIADIIKIRLKNKIRTFKIEYKGRKIEATTDDEGIEQVIKVLESLSKEETSHESA